ncbi:sugar ABC transporter ATPase [Paraburkholderia unamae]|nr:sugar ABC transporter ATPase [Paraburkholderia unamae]
MRILIGTFRCIAHATPPMKTLTQRLLAATALALVAACGSTPPSSSADNGEPMIYASSARSTSSVANCLEDRLPHVHTSRDGNATELSVGSRSDASYLVTLTPNGHGSVIRVTHGASASNDPPEEELRFDVARCTT